MRKIYLFLTVIVFLNSCSTLKYYESYSLENQPSYKLKDILIDLDKDFLGMQRIVHIKAALELSNSGWSLIGYTIKEAKILNNNSEKDIYFKIKNEYWKKWVVDNQNSKNKLQIQYVNEDDNFEDKVNNLSYPILEIIPIFKKSSEVNKTLKVNIDLKIGVPWGHNYYKILLNGYSKNFYWYEIK